MNSKRLILGLVLLLALPSAAQATLISRLDGQAYYDDVLDITWLANANLAVSNTFGVGGILGVGGLGTGQMRWDTANSWIGAMNLDGGTGYLGFNDWRLPTLSPVNGVAFNTAVSNNGTTDIGTGATGIGWQTGAGDFVSEMGYMFYVNLGNLGFCAPNNGDPPLCYSDRFRSRQHRAVLESAVQQLLGRFGVCAESGERVVLQLRPRRPVRQP